MNQPSSVILSAAKHLAARYKREEQHEKVLECHPDYNEASRPTREILRCAQDDKRMFSTPITFSQYHTTEYLIA
jgi:hypothetical protein